jgi:hypothetical protein
MQFSLAPSDLEYCARTIAAMDDGHPEHVRASLAWLIRNRLSANTESDGPPCVEKTCRQILTEAVGRIASRETPDFMSSPDWCRLYAVDVPGVGRGFAGRDRRRHLLPSPRPRAKLG